MTDEKLKSFLIENDYILKVYNNTVYNKTIIEYYKEYEKRNNISSNRISALNKCNKFWSIDVYDHNEIKDYVSTSLCHDRFCNNCKKVKQATRMSRYIPELEPYADNLYHITFTVPNVSSVDLKDTLIKMKKAFRNFMRIVRGNYRCDYNFCKYGYKGAVRSLEITFNEDEYHPHYHCAFVFTNLDISRKDILNAYSFDYRQSREDRYFSDFEILVQKLWYLCYNNLEISTKTVNELELGYSCMCEKFCNNDYAELFKYMTKETDEKDNVLTYENFVTLYESTYRLKQIQGYGCLYQIKDIDLTEEIDKVYADIKQFLEQDEQPRCSTEDPYDLLNSPYKIISRKKIYQYLKEVDKKEKSIS